MNSGLYNKELKCPVCSNNIEVTKVKASACKVESRDTDFCVYYQETNPMLYEVWVCEFCGYAASSDRFEEITERDIQILRENIMPRWIRRSFTGERDTDTAIEALKLALLNLQVREAKAYEFARILLRIAWMYRLKKNEKEQEFLNYTLKYYQQIYDKETLPIDKLDEGTCMYMIAELNRRVGNLDESIQWFSRLISSPEARKNPKLIENARDQYQLAKEQVKKSKNAS